MKVKLLKKTRKRFEIIHMPNGLSAFGDVYNYNLFELNDLDNSYFRHYAQCGRKEGTKQFEEDHRIFETEKECIDYLKSIIIYRLRKEGYRGVKDKKIEQSYKKVWFN
jgi:hypothetical protein